MNVIELFNVEEFEKLDFKKRIIVFKYSAICPISHAAENQFDKWAESFNDEETVLLKVNVRGSRPLSNYIAEKYSVTHQSPQILIIESNEVKWHESHLAITEEEIKKHL